MKNHPVISLFSGLIISGLILSVLSLIYFFLTFNLAGGETLQEIENQRIVLFIVTLIVSIVTFFVCKQFISKGMRYTAIGTIILPLFTLLVVSFYFIDNLNYHKNFNKTIWEQSTMKPFDMAATLVKNEELIGKTRQEVKEMLGQGHEELGDKNSDRATINYLIENDWTLIVYFENNLAIDAKLRLPMMMTKKEKHSTTKAATQQG